jgi:hypothetical protein
MSADVERLLERAALLPQGDWKAYSNILRELNSLTLPPDQRRDAQQKIIEILGV